TVVRRQTRDSRFIEIKRESLSVAFFTRRGERLERLLFYAEREEKAASHSDSYAAEPLSPARMDSTT
ncbi:MAG: hypothetical protein VX955_14375, partial [Pseudomonadota bacterium]|nr:hypothetical protein [Pseudomonadota bacterium]